MSAFELGKRRAVWVRVGPGLATMAGDGRLWSEPAAVRKTVLELLGVFPLTHLEIDLAAVRAASPDERAWEALLSSSGDWKALLTELWAAIGDALNGRVAWGVALPDPRAVSAGSGDAPEKTMLKSGLQLAGFLRSLRESSLGFVTMDLAPAPPDGIDKALSPALRNGQMYGWGRAIAVADVAAAARWTTTADAVLVRDAGVAAVGEAWRAGGAVGGGLDGPFWRDGIGAGALPANALLFGTLPEGVTARAVVERGRELRRALLAPGA